ncbi:MAG: DinB family protein [Bacteroidota bacterium]
MMIHPLVTQLQFTRSEFVRCFEGVPPEDACRRLESMNCLSWIVGHLAWQEHFFWVQMAQGQNIASGLRQLVGFRQPASTPPWDEMWTLWHAITKAADVYLYGLKPEELNTHLIWEGNPITENVGILLLKNIYHYWFHLGKAHAIRQMLGHTDLPVYVGNMPNVRFAHEG